MGEAVSSVLAGHLLPDTILLVSDFDPGPFCPPAPRGGRPEMRWVGVGSPDQGPKVAAAVRESPPGSLLAFLDDDDLWERRKLALVIQPFLKDPSVSLVNHAHVEFSDGPGRPPRRPLWKIVRDLRGGRTRLAGVDYYGNASSMVVRREALVPHLALIERFGLAIDDALFWLGLAAGRVVSDPTALTRIRIHGSNSSRREDGGGRRALTERRFATYEALSELLADDREAGGPVPPDFLRRYAFIRRERDLARERAAYAVTRP